MSDKTKKILKIVICVFVILKTISIINMFLVNDLSFALLWPAFISAVPAIFFASISFLGVFGVVIPIAYILVILFCSLFWKYLISALL